MIAQHIKLSTRIPLPPHGLGRPRPQRGRVPDAIVAHSARHRRADPASGADTRRRGPRVPRAPALRLRERPVRAQLRGPRHGARRSRVARGRRAGRTPARRGRRAAPRAVAASRPPGAASLPKGGPRLLAGYPHRPANISGAYLRRIPPEVCANVYATKNRHVLASVRVGAYLSLYSLELSRRKRRAENERASERTHAREARP